MDFTEKQQIKLPLLWLLIFATLLRLFLKIVDGNATPRLSLLMVTAVLIFVLLLTIRLIVTIDNTGRKIILFPFTKKEIRWKNIDKLNKVEEGNTVGFGIGCSSKISKRYNLNTSNAILITLTTGEKIIIGTQFPEKILEFSRAPENGK